MGETAFFGATAASQAGNAFAQNQALSGQSYYERKMTDVNSTWAHMRAEEDLMRGDYQANKAHKYGEQVKGAQRAAFGASQVDVNQGSAAQVQSETDAYSALDVLAARNNAFKEMMGIKSQDTEARGHARMNRIARKSEGRQSIIQAGGAIARAGIMADYRRDRRVKGVNVNNTPTYARQYEPMEDE